MRFIMGGRVLKVENVRKNYLTPFIKNQNDLIFQYVDAFF